MAKRGTSGLNMLIGVDKPVGMTSHDVVGRLRRALGEGRIGHAGTLDPLASGVMVVGVGQATRLMAFATAEHKRYVSRFVFGRETVTDDAEGATRLEAPVPELVLDPAWAAEQVNLMLQMTEQLPPAYSAIQVGGVRSYDAARKGDELELAARPIEVTAVQFLGLGTLEDGAPYWDVAVAVSKGTYIRALARDLGRVLQSACYVGDLRRTSSGAVSLADCATLDALTEGGSAALAPLDPVRVLDCPAIELTEQEVADVRCGKRLSVARTAGGAAKQLDEEATVALVHADRLYAVAARRGAALAPQVVFADGIVGVRPAGPSEQE